MTRYQALAAAVLLLLWPGGDARAFLPRDSIAVDLEVVVNTADGTLSDCRASAELQLQWKHESAVSIGEVPPTAVSDLPENAEARAGERWEGQGEGQGTRIRCSSESGADASAMDETGGLAWLKADVGLTANVVREMEDEKTVAVGLAISVRELEGVDDGDVPRYHTTRVERQLVFAEFGDAFVPIPIVGEVGARVLGVHEGFVRVAARDATARDDAGYGVVSVTSDLEDAELFLDGGRIGRVSTDAPTTLSNVRPGLREVAARDSAGREFEVVATVRAGRTVPVHLGPPRDPSTRFRLTPVGKNAAGYETFRREVDGAMVVRIPAGEFLMGNPETERSPLEHRVYVSEFFMDETGVTWGRFKKFAAETGLPLPRHVPYWGPSDEHPMVYVTWAEAREYCSWAGGRLPTEAEREKGARGTDERKYPWGDEEPDPERAVFRRSWGHEATAEVGTHPAGASPYGLQDVGGNVWEWCADWYDGDYYRTSPYRDPKGPPSGRAHVVRGGSWDSRPDVLSSSCRSWGHRGYRDGDFGFRCAMASPR